MSASRSAGKAPFAAELVLHPADKERLVRLCGPMNRNLRQVEQHLGVEIYNFGNNFRVTGEIGPVQITREVIHELYHSEQDQHCSPEHIHLLLKEKSRGQTTGAVEPPPALAQTPLGSVHPRNANQRSYLRSIRNHDISFGIGPAGTGKTYLAVACAVEALERERVQRIVLVRPALEAGERLGFLPGDLAQKVDPYLRPLYDALHAVLGPERADKYLERGMIEVLPLAFMRGRTLNESFIILDEAQNTTVEQMKMFLTRMGFGSTMVIAGDVTQTDLPPGRQSGLNHAVRILRKQKKIGFTYFHPADAVRHALVSSILDAYAEEQLQSAADEDQ